METSLFLAKMLGLTLAVECMAALYKRSELEKMLSDTKALRWFMLLTGLIAFVLGLIIIVLHSVWTPDWRGIITVLGWLILFKGIARLFMPDDVIRWAKAFIGSTWFAPVTTVFLIIGLYLAFVGFWMV